MNTTETTVIPYAAYETAAQWILTRTEHRPTVGIISGSGLGGLAEGVEHADVFPYADVPNVPSSTVAGHAGRFVLGELAGTTVVVMQGRLHLYEGYSLQHITLPVRVMKLLGIETLIVTNAAGGLNADFEVGDIMVIEDHINVPGLAGNNPLRGPNDERFGPRFPDLSNAYSPSLRRVAREVAEAQTVDLQEGIYVMVAGPSYETPAELRFLRTVGADAVGMSTVPEVIVARHGGVCVLGLSLITNKAIFQPRESDDPLPLHEDVVEIGERRAAAMLRLVTGVVSQLPSE